jgi:REP element-mobilizing transposase RayT
MKQAVYSLCYHIVLETGGRKPLIVPGLVEGLQRFFERLVRQLGGVVVGFGGIPNHVHLLVRLPPTAMVSEIVRVLKAESTRWASENRASDLVWGAGYGVFSVGKAQAPEVRALLQRQESHHRRRSYAHEMLALMNGAVGVTGEDDDGISIPAGRRQSSVADLTAECPR